MNNFFKNAKQALDIAQSAAKEINSAYTNHQKARRSSTGSKSRSRSQSNESKKVEVSQVWLAILYICLFLATKRWYQKNDQIGQWEVFFAYARSWKFVQCRVCWRRIECVESCAATECRKTKRFVEQVSDRCQVSMYVFEVLEKINISDAHKILDKFVDQAIENSNWNEIHLACLLGLEDAVDQLASKDTLVWVFIFEYNFLQSREFCNT